MTSCASSPARALTTRGCQLSNKARVGISAPTAWDFSQDLGNLGVNLGFGDFTLKSWDFTVVKEIKLFM
jgi:hypothetical protein